MSQQDNTPIFWCTEVGAPQKMTHTRKADGQEFTVVKTPLTLKASLASGMATDVKYTLWVSDSTVIARAKEGVARTDSWRLAITNSPQDFDSNGPKVNSWPDKTTGEMRQRLVQTIWLVEGVEPNWVPSQMPTARDAGNIASVSFPPADKSDDSF